MKYFLYTLMVFVLLIILLWFAWGKAKFKQFSHDRMMLKMRNTERIIDRNADGIINKEELAQAKKNLMVLDLNADGVLSERELGGPGPAPCAIRELVVIRLIDVDENCAFSTEELDSISVRLSVLDTNGDGLILEEEIVN